MKILVAGDSFAAKWPDSTTGWPDLLSAKHSITNIAQAGVSEYKILKQIESVDLNNYDLIIVCHTSVSRVHTPRHPIHTTDLHKDCDLIITDIESKLNWFNSSLRTAVNWFKYHYDDVYQKDIYQLIRSQINSIVNIPYVSIDHFDDSALLGKETVRLNLSNYWPDVRGNVNHYNQQGNIYVYKQVSKTIDLLTKESV
jgi:uncharacterized protein YfkK (UPF0435 family)